MNNKMKYDAKKLPSVQEFTNQLSGSLNDDQAFWYGVVEGSWIKKSLDQKCEIAKLRKQLVMAQINAETYKKMWQLAKDELDKGKKLTPLLP